MWWIGDVANRFEGIEEALGTHSLDISKRLDLIFLHRRKTDGRIETTGRPNRLD